MFFDRGYDCAMIGHTQSVLQLGFEKGRVLIQKRAFSVPNDMLRGHF